MKVKNIQPGNLNNAILPLTLQRFRDARGQLVTAPRSVAGFYAIAGAVRLLNEILPAFEYDLARDVEELTNDLHQSLAGSPPLHDFDDHLKSAIRSLFGQMEAFTFSLATAVLEVGSPGISNEDLAVLKERDYDPTTDLISTDVRRYPLALRLRTACRWFLTVYGVPEAQDWPEETERHFKDLTRARNRLTHPTHIEDLIITGAFGSFRYMAFWFPAYARHILDVASQAGGLPRTIGQPVPAIPDSFGPIPQVNQVFDDGFYSQVFSNPSIAIRYIGFFSRQLDDELTRAFAYSRTALAPPYNPEVIGRFVRRMIRAITTNLEGLVGFASFFMRAVRRSRGRVRFPQNVKGESPPERAIKVLAAFSAAFGNDVVPEQNSSWTALRQVFDLRDRLTHPRKAVDVLVGVDELSTAMTALDWLLNQAFPAVLLDVDKMDGCLGSRRPKV